MSISWRPNLRRALSSSIEPLGDDDLPDDVISWLISSLYGTEASHGECSGLSQDIFEFSRAPKLLKFLFIQVRRFVSGRSDHGPLSWGVVLAIVSICGHVVQLFLDQQDMLLSTAPREYRKWERFALFRQLFGDVIISNFPAPQEGLGAKNDDTKRLAIPPMILTSLQVAADMLKQGTDATLLPALLDSLAKAIVEGYLKEPFPSDWRRESSRPILDLNAERHRHRGHGHHWRDGESAVELGIMPALQGFNQVQFLPATLSLERLRKIDKRWKVVWTSSLARHLVMREEKTIYVYWPSTTVMRQPR